MRPKVAWPAIDDRSKRKRHGRQFVMDHQPPVVANVNEGPADVYGHRVQRRSPCQAVPKAFPQTTSRFHPQTRKTGCCELLLQAVLLGAPTRETDSSPSLGHKTNR